MRVWSWEKKAAARNELVPPAESEASHLEIHRNSLTSLYFFFNKKVVPHSNWGLVTGTATLYVHVSQSVKTLLLWCRTKNCWVVINPVTMLLCLCFSKIDPTSSSGSYRFSFHLRKHFFLTATLLKTEVTKWIHSSDLRALFWGYHRFLGSLIALSSQD